MLYCARNLSSYIDQHHRKEKQRHTTGHRAERRGEIDSLLLVIILLQVALCNFGYCASFASQIRALKRFGCFSCASERTPSGPHARRGGTG